MCYNFVIIQRLRCSLVFLSAVVFLLHTETSIAGSAKADISLLKRALVKPLGEKTNYGTQRVIGIRELIKDNRKTLLVALNANNKPTEAAIRSGALADIVEVCRILKNWDWPSRVQQVMVGEYITLTNQPSIEPQPILMCAISSETIQKTDWNSFDPGRIRKIATSIRFYSIAK